MPHNPKHIFHASVSLGPGDPVILDDEHLALQFALVDRSHLRKLDSEWQAAGVYVLLRHAQPQSSTARGAEWEMYIGQAKKLVDRLRAHVAGEKDWYTAILVRRKTLLGFNTAHISWLESHLCSIWGERDYVRLTNKTTPAGDEAIAPADYRLMEETLERIEMILVLRGVTPTAALSLENASPYQKLGGDESVVRPKKAHKAVTVITEGNLVPPGATLHCRPDNEVAAEARAEVQLWLDQDPRRGRAKWDPTNKVKQLVWELDGERYSVSGLAQKILFEASGVETHLQGTRWWFTENGQDLLTVAGRGD